MAATFIIAGTALFIIWGFAVRLPRWAKVELSGYVLAFAAAAAFMCASLGCGGDDQAQVEDDQGGVGTIEQGLPGNDHVVGAPNCPNGGGGNTFASWTCTRVVYMVRSDHYNDASACGQSDSPGVGASFSVITSSTGVSVGRWYARVISSVSQEDAYDQVVGSNPPAGWAWQTCSFSDIHGFTADSPGYDPNQASWTTCTQQ